jgi:hypothetical protein
MIANAAFIDSLAGASIETLLYLLGIAEDRQKATAGPERDEFTKAKLAITLEIRGRMTFAQKRELIAA